jgi:hypothetical protein
MDNHAPGGGMTEHAPLKPDDLESIRKQFLQAYADGWVGKAVDPVTLCTLASHLSNHIYAIESQLSAALQRAEAAEAELAKERLRNLSPASIALSLEEFDATTDTLAGELKAALAAAGEGGGTKA